MKKNRKKIRKISFKNLYKKIIGIHDSPEKIARGVAIGVFWGIMPTFGLAILFSIPTAFFLRANKFASIISTFISNPLTTPIFYTFGYTIGQYILNSPEIESPSFFWRIIRLENLWAISKSLLLGNTLLATIMALSFYIITLRIVQRHRRKLSRNKKRYVSGDKNGKNNH